MSCTGGLHLHCSIYFWLKSVTHFSGWSCLTLLYAPVRLALGLLYSGRGVAIWPNVLWSTPFPAQESSLEVTLQEFPWMLKWVMLGRHVMSQVEFVLHCTSQENSIQTKHNMQTDTQAKPCIPNAGQSSICQQTKILIPPWKLVPGGSSATSKQSKLIWTTVGCATCCAWFDHPRQSWLSRCTTHRWCWSWRSGIFNSGHGFICFTLF